MLATTGTALGIDFIDDSIGFVTSQAVSAPHLYTTDGGRSWQPITTSSEAWTPYGDPISKSFFLASELDQLTLTTQTTVVKVPIGSWGETKIKDYGDSGITGGIAGSHVCQSVIYMQGREPAEIAPGGIIRTMDAGLTWKFVGGPNNINDKRFAVTGRGAVVMAFDNGGGVWRTTNGGDGTLSPSVLPFVTISAPADTVRASLCDSASLPILLGYSACDSARISSAAFLNDSLNELSTSTDVNGIRSISTAWSDTLKFLYRPSQSRTWILLLKLTIQQPDGYTEDTIIRIPLIADPSSTNAIEFSGTTAHDTIDFDSVSICSDAFHSLTISNMACGDLTVDSITTSGLPFSLASNVKPFVLSNGNSRMFLIRYAPNSIGTNRGAIYVINSTGRDSIVVRGTGYSSGNAVSFSVSSGTIRSAECDSTQFFVILHNIACKAFAIDSISTNRPFRAGPIPAIDSIQPNGADTLPFTFVPTKVGNDTGTIHLVISYAGAGRYDTLFTVIGNAMGGEPKFSVSHDSLAMGTVPICSETSDSLVIYSSGCTGLTVSAAFDSSNGFSLVRAPKPILSSPDSDTVIVEYHPGDSIGRKTVNLIFTTSAGTDTVPISVVVIAGGGTVAFSVTQNIQASTCESQPFSITVKNSLCDSIVIDSITLGGADAGDFSLGYSVPIALGAGGQVTMNGIFTPQDSLTRSASVFIVIHEADGTLHDTTLALTGLGIAVPPIQVALGVTNLNAGAGQTVTLPILAKRGSTTNMSAFDFTLLLNTDLLTPIAVNSNGYFGNLTPTISISNAANGSAMDTVHVQFQGGNDAILPAGELCELVCEAYITSATSTGIVLHGVQFHDANGSDQCLASENGSGYKCYLYSRSGMRRYDARASINRRNPHARWHRAQSNDRPHPNDVSGSTGIC